MIFRTKYNMATGQSEQIEQRAYCNEGGEKLVLDADHPAPEMRPLTAEEMEAHLNPVPTPEQLSSIERAWRDGELDRADIELNKVQDGMGTGTVGAWREYRCALRGWPESEFFPDSTKRPVAPDAPATLPVGE